MQLNLQTGTRFYLENNYTFLEPHVLVRYMENAPLSADINLKYNWKNTFWLGVGYRTTDALLFFGGLKFKNVRLGYSYDAGVSLLNTVHTGSHEIILGLDIFKK
jgi:type IX secretion system PorP/SprF family membrane protein